MGARGESRWLRLLLPVLAILWLGELAVPILQLLGASLPPLRTAPALVGAALFVATYLWAVRDAARARAAATRPRPARLRLWAPTVVLAGLAVVLSATYGLVWLGLFIFASVGSALRLPPRDAARAIVGLTLVSGTIGLAEGDPVPDLLQGGLLVAGIGAVIATVDYSIRTTSELRAARAELARLAVAQERLRFARDLHDLLDHSLSLVALKCDLAEQLVAAAPERAAQEIHEAADVTRQALRDVRAAVAGYRRPTLVQELAGAQEMLAAAGIGCHLEAARLELSPEREAAVAWAVREGVTNVIRHSRARRCVIRLEREDGQAILTVSDDGQGGRRSALPETTTGGSGLAGLAGLAERLHAVGGSLQTSPASEAGFRLAARVSLEQAGTREMTTAGAIEDRQP